MLRQASAWASGGGGNRMHCRGLSPIASPTLAAISSGLQPSTARRSSKQLLEFDNRLRLSFRPAGGGSGGGTSTAGAMVRSGHFEMKVVGSDGRALPEVADASGKTYVVAEPGSPFQVQVTLLPNSPALPKGEFYNALLAVDGVDVGTSKHIHVPCTSTFRGFLKAGDTQACSYRSFVFATPKESEAKQVTSLNFVEGTIKVQVRQAEFTWQTSHERVQGPVGTNDSVAKLPEGKKFFLAPSLTTQAGELKMGAGMDGRSYRVTTGTLHTLELRYETAATLMLRRVLRREVPAHRAILQMFPETAVKDEEAAGENDENGHQQAGPSGRAIKREQPVKRERGTSLGTGAGQAGPLQPKRQRQQQQAETVDLTKLPAANDEVLAAKAANKVLECDLTGDDDDEGQWRAVKKEVHRLALGRGMG